MIKKNIFVGVLLIAASAVTTSCSHDLDDMTPQQQAVDTYKRIFVETFGKPAANHTWGFEPIVQSATSRMLTRAENANGNEWADIKNSTGYGGWLVPDTLTEGQKERVRKYFQANPNLTFEDPHLENFFVQQVYKGATEPGPNSTEIVTAANGTQYTSSNMNLMTVGEANVHINNFNYGDCSVYGNVLDNGSDILAGKTSYHADKIMLMVDIDDTSCFGYHETGGSKHHNDKAALVGAEVIDAWAAENGNPGEPVVDKWNRSFLGYDLELLNSEDVQKDQPTMKYNDGPESYNYAMVDGEVISINGNDEIIFNEKTVGYVSTNTNMYSVSEKLTIGDGDIQQEYRVDGAYMGKYFNLDKINELLADGFLPVRDKNLREWVKVTGSDGYFSDWIVTLTKAERIDGEPEETWSEWVRIIAEDLSVTQRTDFDFNDVVFDVRINTTEGREGTKAQIKLKAAGGTLPLTVGWSGETGTSYAAYEVHNMYGVATNVMVNTHAKNGVDGKADVIKTLTGTFSSANDVKVMVQKYGEWTEITAHTGEPASKIQVKTTYVWCDERDDISKIYDGSVYPKSFTDYVSDPSVASDWYEE